MSHKLNLTVLLSTFIVFLSSDAEINIDKRKVEIPAYISEVQVNVCVCMCAQMHVHLCKWSLLPSVCVPPMCVCACMCFRACVHMCMCV